MKNYLLFATLLAAACTTSSDPVLSSSELDSKISLPNNIPIYDDLGASTTYSTQGNIDLRNDFFKSFGTNGRTCGSCHTPSDGWTMSAEHAQVLFDLTGGTDPLFRTNDGTNSPNADVSTVDARRAASSMLLSHGDIRVGIGIPANAEFSLAAVDDPYGYASANELSLFRRPLPATNLAFDTIVMWDGRVTGATIRDALSAQADGATLGHAQAMGPLPPADNAQVVDFESSLFNAQIISDDAGRLDKNGANGGAEALVNQPLETGRWDLFDKWANSDEEAKRAVYRGQELFNTKKRTNGAGACIACHSAKNVGTNATGTFFKIGVSDAVHRTAEYPLYTLENNTTHQQIQTSDPGKALITGLWNDIGRFKVPSLRGLGARAPYFHNGSAATVRDVVHFYEDNLKFSFTPDEENDLVAFLSAL